MEVSTEKGKIITNSTKRISADISMNGQKLEKVISLQYLGAILWENPRHKLRLHLYKTQSSKVFPLKLGVGHNIALRASPTARDFFLLTSTFPVHSPSFFQNLSRVFPVLAVTNTDSFVGLQNKTGNPTCRHRRLMQVPVLSACGI